MCKGLGREAQITDYWLWDFFDSICGFSWGNFNHDACIYIYMCTEMFFGIIILHRNRKACRIIQHHIEDTSTDPNMNWHEDFMLPCQSKSKIIYTTMFFLCFQTMSRENGDNCTSFSPNHRKPWTGIVTLDMPRAESWWSWSSFPNHSWNGGPHVLVPPVLNHDQLERPGCHMSCTRNTACRNVSGVFPAWRIHRRAGHAIYST